MPQILIVADSTESSEVVVYRERVDAIHLSSEHGRQQLAERLAWAVGDAAQTERWRRTYRASRERRLEEARVA
jgi:hypothetical protein